MFKTSKIFSGLLAVGALAVMIGGGVSASAASGPGDGTTNLSGNGTSVTESSPVFEAGASPAKATSTAEFQIKSGKLVLVAVPDFNFGDVDGQVILNGGKKESENNDVNPAGQSKNKTAYDGNNAGKLIIYDRRGTTDGWTLQLAMNTTFKAGLASENLSDTLINIKLDVKSDTTTSLHKPLQLIGTDIGGSGAQIVDGLTNGAGDTEFNMHPAGSATLNFPTDGSNPAYLPDKPYQSDLTWTLTAGA